MRRRAGIAPHNSTKSATVLVPVIASPNR